MLSHGHLPHVRCGHFIRNVRFLQKGLDNILKQLHAFSTRLPNKDIDLVCLNKIPMSKNMSVKWCPSIRITQLIEDLITGNAPLICLTKAPTTLADFALPALYVAEKLHRHPESLPLLAKNPSSTAVA